MENLQISFKQKVIFAFPGMGKTPLAKTHLGYIDLDWGFIRHAFDISKANETMYMKQYSKLIREYFAEGWNVLVNEPKAMEWITMEIPSESIVVYLPLNPSYSAKKLSVSKRQVEEWVDGWAFRALRHNIKVIYLDVGLDKYLS